MQSVLWNIRTKELRGIVARCFMEQKDRRTDGYRDRWILMSHGVLWNRRTETDADIDRRECFERTL